MKKLTLLLFVGLFLVSCKKEDVPVQSTEWRGTTFVRIESVGKDGKSTYSNITYIKIK
jgi:hypothetical protein